MYHRRFAHVKQYFIGATPQAIGSPGPPAISRDAIGAGSSNIGKKLYGLASFLRKKWQKLRRKAEKLRRFRTKRHRKSKKPYGFWSKRARFPPKLYKRGPFLPHFCPNPEHLPPRPLFTCHDLRFTILQFPDFFTFSLFRLSHFRYTSRCDTRPDPKRKAARSEIDRRNDHQGVQRQHMDSRRTGASPWGFITNYAPCNSPTRK